MRCFSASSGFSPSTLLVIYQSDTCSTRRRPAFQAAVERSLSGRADGSRRHRCDPARGRSESDLGRWRHRLRHRRARPATGGGAAAGAGVRGALLPASGLTDVGGRRPGVLPRHRNRQPARPAPGRGDRLSVRPGGAPARLRLGRRRADAAGRRRRRASRWCWCRSTSRPRSPISRSSSSIWRRCSGSVWRSTIRSSSLAASARSWRPTAATSPAAVERTMATAGKAVFFSGATVLIGLMGLALFEFMFLRSVGIAGVIVVAWSTLAALDAAAGAARHRRHPASTGSPFRGRIRRAATVTTWVLGSACRGPSWRGRSRC